MYDRLSKSPFFAKWHPAVLQAYIDHGTYRPSPDSAELRLKCTPYQEASGAPGSLPLILLVTFPKPSPRGTQTYARGTSCLRSRRASRSCGL